MVYSSEFSKFGKFHFKTKNNLPREYLYLSTDLSQFHGSPFGLVWVFTVIIFRISSSVGQSITEVIWGIGMHIWCIKIRLIWAFNKSFSKVHNVDFLCICQLGTAVYSPFTISYTYMQIYDAKNQYVFVFYINISLIL
jgi:hypothetical protein